MIKNINLHVYPSNFKHETRILKETKSLVDSGMVNKVFIAALWEKGDKEHEQLDDKREVWRITLKTKCFPNESLWEALKFVEWSLKIFSGLKKRNINVVHCHHLLTLPIGALFKTFRKAKIIYDAHELETERNEWSGIKKAIAKIFERILMSYVDQLIVVSDSISEWYKTQYNLKEVSVIKNVPYRQDNRGIRSNILKERFNIQDNEILFIYQGSLNKGRGIEILLNAFSQADKKKHILFMGHGTLESTVKFYETNFSNIHFYPSVNPAEVISYTTCADVGISLIENTCLSYKYSLPNKMFEYIFSGLPLIVSNLPDMGKIIDDFKCGWKVSINKNSVSDLIKSISKENIEEKRYNVLNCKDNFGWDIEEKKLLRIYRNLNRGKIKKS